jgi:hypothetical protein
MNKAEEYFDDLYENSPHENCPKCGRTYDDIDFDYQCCSKCGWDAEHNKGDGFTRYPGNKDYLNGDADILTGEWV